MRIPKSTCSSEGYKPKTLCVFPRKYAEMVLPEIKDLLISMQDHGDKIYTVLNCPLGHADFKGAELCQLTGT